MICSQALLKGLRDRFPPTRQIQKRIRTVGITLTLNKIKSIIYINIVFNRSTLTNSPCSTINKRNSWRPAAYSSAMMRSAISRTAAKICRSQNILVQTFTKAFIHSFFFQFFLKSLFRIVCISSIIFLFV